MLYVWGLERRNKNKDICMSTIVFWLWCVGFVTLFLPNVCIYKTIVIYRVVLTGCGNQNPYAHVDTICTCAVLIEMAIVTSHIWSIFTQVCMLHTIRTCGKIEEISDVTMSISPETAQVHMVSTSAYGFPHPVYEQFFSKNVTQKKK